MSEKKEKPKMSRKPTAKQIDPKAVDSFLEAAEAVPGTEQQPKAKVESEAKKVVQKPTQPKPKKIMPWEAEIVREDVIKSINLRLPEPYMLKLKYLSEVTHKSQQVIIKEVLLPHIDKEIKKFIKE